MSDSASTETKAPKQANLNMKKHQRYLAAQKQSKPASTNSTIYSTFKLSLLVLLTALLASRALTESWTFNYTGKYVQLKTYLPKPSLQYFTPAELSLYDGLHPPKPIYLAIDGDVYDVTSGGAYQVGGSYHHFTGKDGARSFVTGCFKPQDITHDIRGLDEKSVDSLKYWKAFYAESDKYGLVGKVLHPPIDPATPIPTPCN